MIKKIKKSISLSNSIMEEVTIYNRNGSISAFIEKALALYLKELRRQESGRRDKEIINANAKRFKREAEENLKYQVML